MKKLLALLLSCLCLLALVSCGNAEESSEASVPEPPMKLKIASYNIKNGAYVKHDFTILAEDLTRIDADIVGLQEVDMNTTRNGNQDTLAILSENTPYKYYKFCHCIDHQGGEYGTAVMSKYPIVSFEITELESFGLEQRALGHAVIDVNGKNIDFFNTHLTYQEEEDETCAAQFITLAEEFSKCEKAIMTGDFNTPHFEDFEPFGDIVMVNNYDTVLPSYEGADAIDNILATKGTNILDYGIDDELETAHSDHFLIWAVLEIPA